MNQTKRETVLNNMVKIGEQVDTQLDTEFEKRESMIYYHDFEFEEKGFGITDVYIVEIQSQEQTKTGDRSGILTYAIYDKDSQLIATVTEDGKVHFTKEYLEQLREIDARQLKLLNLQDINFELPQELDKEDIAITREELYEHELKGKQEGVLSKGMKEEEPEKQDLDKKQEQGIAKAKGIPANNVLKIRENSNLYKDHPNLEKNLYFYKGADGNIRAEYIDENGNPQPSKYFETSTTAIRQETIEMGDDGEPVTREIPYQVMKTKGLAQTDKDVRDVRININIDSYGYLEISEARQGKNGMWAAHDIEVTGRNYNSHNLNEATSIRTRKADPDKQTDAYEQVEDTGLVQDGVQYSEMYLIAHSEEIIQKFIDEGYNKEEAITIFDLMIGEETLTEEQAKERVNEEIKAKEPEEKETQRKGQEDDDEYTRTPW